MFLKRLEIHGFKSFPEKTVFSFENGTTAIVGPNGCGKSNVSDAIKWVIGEQKAKSLRGGTMQDVIFSGSDAMKPLGMAEVSLILDNSQGTFPLEFSEIKITRKLFRSGESDYQINKKRCRLRDITDLLMDTGLGADSYSVIEQGRMDRVLTSKPEERRFVFEEAAGITKYKARRKEALRKLERTADNLLRVNDILIEVTRQMKSIERQARKAQRYQEFFTELKGLDIYFYKQEAAKFEEALSANRTALTQLSENDQSIHADIEVIEFELKDLHASVDVMDQDLSMKQKELSDAQSKYQVLQNQIQAHQSNITDIERQLSQHKDDAERSQEKVIQLQEDAQRTDDEVLLNVEQMKNLNVQLEESGFLLKELDEELQRKNQDLDAHKKSILDLVSEQSRNKDLMVHREHSMSQHERKKDDLLQQKDLKTQRRKELTSSILRQKEACVQTQEQLEQNETKREALQRQQEQLEQEIEQANERVSQKRSDLSAHKSELDVLQAMHKNYEGYSQGTKEILKKRDQNEGIYQNVKGDLASIISIKDSRYEGAIESVLGQYVQSILVTEVDQLEPMLEHLRSHKIGRAAFIPMDMSKAPSVHTSVVEQCAGFVARVLDVVDFPTQHHNLMNMILGDIFIFEDFTSMVKAFRKTSLPHCKFVSLTGDVLEGTGNISGGSNASQKVHLIGREKKLKDLSAQVERFQQELQDAELHVQAQKKILDDVRNQLFAVRKDGDALLRSLNQKEQELSRYEVEVQHLEDQMQMVHGELGDLALRQDEIVEELKDLKAKNTTIDDEVLQRQQQLQIFQATVDEVDAKRREKNTQLTTCRVDIASFKEKEQRLKQQQRHIQQMQDEETRRQEENANRVEGLLSQRVQLTGDIERLRSDVEIALNEKDLFYEQVENMQVQRKQSFQKARDKEHVLQQFRNRLMDLQKDIKEEELKQNQFEMKIDMMRTRVFETYQLDWDLAMAMEAPEMDEELQLEERILFLKDKIAKIGPVNTEAIQEYDTLKERDEFLNQQVSDLNEAKESLLKVIAQVNKESRKRFREAFEQINTNFKELFKVLFGGGRAELRLLDENDVLECGIEISASPPGKKMQSIGLLSGGERAMTGIALLFAMFKVNPSPFCVLDEIDAPLDEANVDRFVDIMCSFKDRTQFILITHNKKTMAKADIIYGVTMQKPGISKSIAIKLVDFEAKPQELVTA